jgi:hypothetical protein
MSGRQDRARRSAGAASQPPAGRGDQDFSLAWTSMVWPATCLLSSTFFAGVDLVGAFLDAFLEALDRAAEILADVLQLCSAEDQDDDQQDDQPVPDRERTHDELR